MRPTTAATGSAMRAVGKVAEARAKARLRIRGATASMMKGEKLTKKMPAPAAATE